MDLMGMMSKAKELQERMQQVQAEIADMEVEGVSGGGMVRVVMDGKGMMKNVAIDPTLMVPGEVEVVQDLVLAAANDARGKAESALQERMREITGGLGLPPGMNLPI